MVEIWVYVLHCFATHNDQTISLGLDWMHFWLANDVYTSVNADKYSMFIDPFVSPGWGRTYIFLCVLST